MISTGLRDDLVVLSRAINADPELAYQERRAVHRIALLLAKYGHEVERPFGGLETAFRGRIGPPGKSVALLAEYDALPEVGHGCGHNLIAMTNVGAFLALGESARDLRVGVELIGTPAEEAGGGKIDLIDAGAFRDSVAVLSSHPAAAGQWRAGGTSLGVVEKRVTYRGVASHAAASPEKGRNALNGVIRLFVGIDGWRQHLPPDTRVHGIITKGGTAANVIPEHAEALFGLRARELGVLEDLVATFADIAQGAALQTGTTVEIADEMRLYMPMRSDPELSEMLAKALATRGVTANADPGKASTDLGNVSQLVPTAAVAFPVTTAAIPGHSHAMQEASVSDLAHENAFIVLDVLAETALAIARGAR